MRLSWDEKNLPEYKLSGSIRGVRLEKRRYTIRVVEDFVGSGNAGLSDGSGRLEVGARSPERNESNSPKLFL